MTSFIVIFEALREILAKNKVEIVEKEQRKDKFEARSEEMTFKVQASHGLVNLENTPNVYCIDFTLKEGEKLQFIKVYDDIIESLKKISPSYVDAA